MKSIVLTFDKLEVLAGKDLDIFGISRHTTEQVLDTCLEIGHKHKLDFLQVLYTGRIWLFTFSGEDGPISRAKELVAEAE